MLTLTAIQQLDIQLQARGESLTVSQIVRHLHIGRREALALLDAYRSAPPTVPAVAPVVDPVPEAAEPPPPRPIGLCGRCCHGAWTDVGFRWVCAACGYDKVYIL
jgi:hypothetical protein